MGYNTDLLKETTLKCGCIESKYKKSHDFFGDSIFFTDIIKCFKHKTNYAFINEEDESSDDEEDESSLVEEAIIKDQVKIQPSAIPSYKVFLDVPFEYKSDVKELDAQFDFNKKKWYIYSDSKHHATLVKIFDSNNFTTSYYGTKMKSSILEQLIEYKEECKEEITQMYEDIKERKESYERHLEQKNKMFNCECGGKYKSATKTSHYNTNKHKKYFKYFKENK